MLSSQAMFNGMTAPILPPLPTSWTEHVAPTGHLYYYNSVTLESTYMRPLSLSSLFPPSLSTAPTKPAKKKKEKPAKKTLVPDSTWIRVLTDRGNVFFHNSDTKESTWEVPKEIQEVVEGMEFNDVGSDAEMGSNQPEGAPLDESGQSPSTGKRKLREEEENLGERDTKRQRVDATDIDSDEEAAQPLADVADDGDESQQKESAEEMAVEGVKEEPEATKDEFGREAIPKLPVEEAKELFRTLLSESRINPLHPWETSLSIFSPDPRYLILTESLSPNALLDLFEDYCRERLKEQRASQNASSSTTQSPLDAYKGLLRDTVISTRMTYTQFRQQVKKDRRFYSYGRDEKEREKVFRAFLKELGDKKREERKRAEEAFLSMLKEGDKKGIFAKEPGQIPKWSDVKKAFQKDPRYDEVGSSSLREELYDTFAKTSSHEETTKSVGSVPGHDEQHGQTTIEEERKKRREKAVKEREERVRNEKERVERENLKSRVGLSLAETELAFKSLLVDTIRDPTVSFSAAMNYLSADPRFASITQSTQMPQNRLQFLFQEHVVHLLSKGSTALSALFESYAPGLDRRWDDLPPKAKESIASSSVSKRLGLDTKISLGRARRGSHHNKVSGSDTEDEEKERFEYPALRQEFDRWQRQRHADARVAFDTMLSENAFVGFWGRVGKMGLTDDEEKKRLGKVVFAEGGGLVDTVSMDVDEIGEGEGGGGKADLQRLAKGVDVKEMERVLRSDKRFTVFDYMPQERERWLQDYVRNLTAPKASVHVG